MPRELRQLAGIFNEPGVVKTACDVSVGELNNET
jgi:hypothetical protein